MSAQNETSHSRDFEYLWPDLTSQYNEILLGVQISHSRLWRKRTIYSLGSWKIARIRERHVSQVFVGNVEFVCCNLKKMFNGI